MITGAGWRRRWTTEAKARIIAESYAGDVPVSEVARRHGMRPQQLFGWRHQTQAGHLAPAGAGVPGVPSFVPIVADARGAGAPRPTAAPAGAAIEIEVGGMIVWVRGRVAAGALAEVLAAVKSVP